MQKLFLNLVFSVIIIFDSQKLCLNLAFCFMFCNKKGIIILLGQIIVFIVGCPIKVKGF